MTQKDSTKIFEKYYNEWISNPERLKSGYDYKKTYAEMMRKVGKEIFQNSVGEIPIDKNRKKPSIHLWENRY
ncbi:MAG: hypothetical protein GQ527_11385, partial [Bacteroidales bacterium]|nr:hypothetical protein [Bacteroidales bacterium]